MTIHKQANTAQNVEATDMTLLEECLDVLKKYSIIEDKELEEQILSNLKSTFYGKIDFSKYADAHEINFEEIRQLPDESEYYVIWDNAAIPIIKCNIEDILDNIYDVLAVSFKRYAHTINRSSIYKQLAFLTSSA